MSAGGPISSPASTGSGHLTDGAENDANPDEVSGGGGGGAGSDGPLGVRVGVGVGVGVGDSLAVGDSLGITTGVGSATGTVPGRGLNAMTSSTTIVTSSGAPTATRVNSSAFDFLRSSTNSP